MSASDSPGLVLHIQRVVTLLQLLLQCCSTGPGLVPHSPTSIPELLQGLIKDSAIPLHPTMAGAGSCSPLHPVTPGNTGLEPEPTGTPLTARVAPWGDSREEEAKHSPGSQRETPEASTLV